MCKKIRHSSQLPVPRYGKLKAVPSELNRYTSDFTEDHTTQQNTKTI